MKPFLSYVGARSWVEDHAICDCPGRMEYCPCSVLIFVPRSHTLRVTYSWVNNILGYQPTQVQDATSGLGCYTTDPHFRCIE